MKYYATLDGRTYEIAVDPHGHITVDGLPMHADMREVGRLGLYSLLLDNQSHEVVIEPDPRQRSVYHVLVEGTRYTVKVQDERSRRLSLADRSLKAPQGEVLLKAPIPGLIIRVLVEPGQDVSEGEPLLTLEAMKMENDLRAPRAGTVHEVKVRPGMEVGLGQVLMTIR
jgi:biotin carboxyl carrier protein